MMAMKFPDWLIIGIVAIILAMNFLVSFRMPFVSTTTRCYGHNGKAIL